MGLTVNAYQAGTDTGRALGSIVGANLAAFTAELGGKVIWREESQTMTY